MQSIILFVLGTREKKARTADVVCLVEEQQGKPHAGVQL